MRIEEELAAREPIFHRPESGTTRADFEAMTADDFWEVGASGRKYARGEILDILDSRHATPHEDVWEIRDFQCRRLAADIYLVTYMLIQDRQRETRRATIWQRTEDGWKIMYHQGTLIQSQV